MQSGRGDQVSDGAYRPLPIPREPQTPAVPEAREGVVLPAQGEQWNGQPQGAPLAGGEGMVQPVAGQPRGPLTGAAQAAPPQQPAAHASADGEATRPIPPDGTGHHHGHARRYAPD